MNKDYSWDDISKTNPRMSKVANIIELIIFMQSKLGGVSLQDIQDRFGKSRRTAERMRDCVMDICPVEEIYNPHEKCKRWGFVNYSLKEIINFTPEEIATLEKIKEKSDTLSKKDIINIIDKIKALNSKKQSTLAELEQNVEILLKSEGLAMSQQPKYNISIENISIIRHAIKSTLKIKGVYKGKPKLLSPLGIVFGEKIYLIAREEDKRMGEYVYQLHNLDNIELLNENFNTNGFDIKKYTEKSFGVYQGEIYNVKLKFSPEAEKDVTHYMFHQTQKIKKLSDGSISVTFKASVDKHILWHLFKWGDLVEIIEPKNLRAEYIETLKMCMEKQLNIK